MMLSFTPDDPFINRYTDFQLALIVLFFAAGATAFVWALLRAATSPPPIALVLALSVLSLSAIGAAIVTGNGDFITLSATGIGALAGAVMSTWERRFEDKQELEDEVESSEDES